MFDAAQNPALELPVDPVTRRIKPHAKPTRTIAVETHVAALDNLGEIIGSAGSIGGQLKALSSLFQKSLMDADSQPAKFRELIDECFLIADIAETMAARLSALETQGLERLQQHRLEASR